MTFIVADDVFYARKAVEKMILEWDADSIILASCGDGATAAALMEQHTPDVLITDICMPGEDGLALAQLARQRWPEMRIILVTGYASFEYARKAINSGVCSYLLKPLKKQELFDALDELSNALKQSSRQQARFNVIRHSAESFRLTQYLASGGISGEVPPDSAAMCADGFTVAAISAPGQSAHALCTVAQRIFGEGIECHEDVLHTGNALVLLYAPHKGVLDLFYANVCAGLGAMADILHTYTPVVAIGVSAPAKGADCLPQAYTQARRALCMRLVYPSHYVFPFDAAPAATPLFTHDQLRALRTRMQATRWEDARSLLFAHLDSASMLTQLEEGYQALLGICYTLYSERTSATQQAGQILPRQLWDFESCEELWRYLRILADTGELEPTVAGNDVVDEIKAFLEENYYCELSLNELASTKYYMNPNYLSRLFKAKTGKGFSRYLLEVRMLKAQELLHEDELNIAEVAALVGYTSPSHFTQSFKKMFGDTPGSHKGEKSC